MFASTPDSVVNSDIRNTVSFGLRRSPSAKLLKTLKDHFGNRFSTALAVLLQHGTDESHYASYPPDVVVFASSTNDVAFTMAACNIEAVPVIPFGVGSSVEGHLLAIHGGVCIDLSQMNNIVQIRTEDLSATVQAGVTREQLNQELANSGYFFSVDPGANASVGGMVATAASGTNSVRYGTMRENVLSLTVVTAEGQIIRTASRARKSSAGYNLTQLYCGSEGTFGIITEISVRLHPLPEKVLAAVVNFPSTREAVDTVIQAMQMGISLARAEMLDALTIKAINAHSKTTLTEAPTLFLEFAGSTAQIDEDVTTIQNIATEFNGGEFQWATLPEERSRIWKPRHHAYFAALQLKPGCKSFTTDACVPLSRLADCLDETIKDLGESGLPVPIFGHVGDGNFHCLILEYGGTCTGEHGVGLHKMDYLEREHGKGAVDIMRRIKSALDPNNICNPGKVVRLTTDTDL
jgi:D-lactate dehydrogenase (cytochrome)